jgi:hypothetical protein
VTPKACKLRALFFAFLWVGLALSMSCQPTHRVPVQVYGLSPTGTEADFIEANKLRNHVELALLRQADFAVMKVPTREAVYQSFDHLLAARKSRDIQRAGGIALVVRPDLVEAKNVVVFTAMGGPSWLKVDSFTVDPEKLESAYLRVARLASGYGHIMFDVTTIPPRTDIYVDDHFFRTTDDRGRFRDTYTWPARDYRIRFLAWIQGKLKASEEVAQVVPKETILFRKSINLEK